MNTAQMNIAKLPAECFGVLLIDRSLIKIKAGESGYYPVKNMTPPPEEMMKRAGFNTMSAFCDHLNEKDCITKQQRKAMEWGSQFAWGHKMADPDNFDPAGVPYSENNPRPTTIKA